jgi:SAM-dependent methyltransferase
VTTPPDRSFDQFSGDYERLLDDPLRKTFAGDSAFFIVQKCRALQRALDRTLPMSSPRRVLDAGCGHGTALEYLSGSCRVVGSDVSWSMLEPAVRKAPVVVQEPFDLPFRADTFDAAFAFCVYHHIETTDHVKHMRELARVVRPGGMVFVFEHNPLNPITRLVFHRAPIDRGCQLIPRRRLCQVFRDAGLREVDHGYVLFVPEVLQRPLGAVEPYLEWLPAGGQYYVCGRVS